MKSNKDVVVSGLGVVGPCGIGMDPLMDSLHRRECGFQMRPEYADSHWPFRVAGIVQEFEPKQYIKPRKSMKLMCREIQFGFAAATLAIDDSGLDIEAMDPTRIGVVCGTDTFYCDPNTVRDSFEGIHDDQTELSKWIEQAMKTIEPLWMLKYLPNMTASHVAIYLDAQGPNNTVIQGDASGLLAIIEAADVIRRGWADVMLVGGTGSKVHPTYLAYHGIDWLAQPDDDISKSCQPFGQERNGSVCSEGAGMIVIETRESAEARGAEIYATLSSFHYGCRQGSLEEESELLAKVMQTALTKAELDASQVDHVNAHATGETEQDQLEANAIAKALPDVEVAAYKGYLGNLGPPSGVIESAISLRGIRDQKLPGSLNGEDVDADYPIKVMTQERTQTKPAFMKLGMSSTGQKVALVFDAS